MRRLCISQLLMAFVTLVSSSFAMAAGSPRKVTCSIISTAGGSSETGEGGSDTLVQFILQGSGQPARYTLFYVNGAQEETYIRDLACTFSAKDPTQFRCDQVKRKVKDCVQMRTGFFSRTLVEKLSCTESISTRIVTKTFVQTDRPKQSGGCYAE